MNALLQDLRYALHAFRRAPGFTLAVIASLAIGIGANTALFSVTSALLLRPLPYRDADRLVILWNRSPGLNIAEDWVSTAQYFDVKNSHQGFEQVAIAFGDTQNLTGLGAPERVGVVRVSSNLLPMLGARPALGRLYLPEEDHEGRAPAAVLTHGLWDRRFGHQADAVGKSLTLNGRVYEIVGVLPQSFTLPKEVLPTLYGAEQTDVFLSLPLAAAAANNRGAEDYNIIGMLKPGVSEEQAQAEMDTITARLRRDFPQYYPPNGGLTFDVVPLQQQVVGGVRTALLVLTGAVGFVLLIACANAANLLLSRAVARQREIAVRQALGAASGRIIRQLLTESVLLAVCAGVLGVLLALAGVKLLGALGPKSVPRLGEIGVHGGVLFFTLLLSLLAGVLFGLAPAMRLARLDVANALKETGRGAAGASAVWGRGNRLRKLLVAAQLALSVMLLIGAGLLVRSFARVASVHPGFEAKNVLTLNLTMAGKKYDSREPVLETYRRLWETLSQIPGVTAAGGNSFLPFSDTFAWTPISVEGRVALPGEKFIQADVRHAAGDYFRAMQIPLVSGRTFNEHDTAANPRVAIVDEFMAREMWPGQDAVGKRFRFGGADSTAPWVTVVGVVGRVKHEALETDPRITAYIPHTQSPRREMAVVLRTAGDPGALTSAVRSEIAKLDPGLPVYSVRTMEDRVAGSLARRRFSMVLLGVFAAIALMLAALGIYATMAYLVSQGTKEIGIRIALGATRAHVLALILRQGFALAVLGAAAGLAGGLALTRVMESLLFGVAARDVATFTAVPLLLTLAALAACYLPARRAAAVDPMVTLRFE